MKVKLKIEDHRQLLFLVENLREFYDESILKWQYFHRETSTSLYLLRSEGDYIASQGMIPIYLAKGETSVLSAKSETSFLLPEHRGKGLFEDLYNYTIQKAEEDGCELIWGFTALSKVWRNKLNFEVHDGLIHETALQLNAKSAFRSTIRKDQSSFNKIKQITKSALDRMKNKRIPKLDGTYETKELEFSDDSISAIVGVFKEWQSNYKNYICIETNNDYINWRVKNNPRAKYSLLGIYSQNVLVGYAIFNIETNYLVEFIVPRETELNECLFSLMAFLKQKKTYSHLNYWASSENEYCKKVTSVLEQFGARRYENFTMNFVRKRTKHTSFDTSEVGEFYINGLWTEGFNI